MFCPYQRVQEQLTCVNLLDPRKVLCALGSTQHSVYCCAVLKCCEIIQVGVGARMCFWFASLGLRAVVVKFVPVFETMIWAV